MEEMVLLPLWYYHYPARTNGDITKKLIKNEQKTLYKKNRNRL